VALAGVIFDLDGVLVDSEPLARRAWVDLLRPHGWTPGPADWTAVTGRTFLDTHAHFARRAGLPDAETVYARYTERLYALFEAELAAFPDAAGVAHELRVRGVPLAVASSSRRERVHRALGIARLADLFPVIVAGDEVARGKPAPDLFLAAAAALGVDPARAVVVEDSPPGVAAARAAGIPVVALARDGDAGLDGADVVTPELTLAAVERAAGR